ncbi:MAG: hypothetical protein OJF55_002877 [Rhodanobacteraceae bacterium]|jgi:hypothetical protein|nr:MAG: hypothetical protein OJF55_002877 [Rhodanobacteraceae bacterium]
MKKLLAMGIAGALAAGFAFTAFAQGGAGNEVSTAHAHALMAQNAKTITEAHAHLHHVINCLVGPKGAGFDAQAEDPCKGQGNGAITDSANDQAMHGKLQNALADAQSGLKSDSLDGVHADAAKAAAALGATPTQKPKGSYSW